jgi:hypothetical protein
VRHHCLIEPFRQPPNLFSLDKQVIVVVSRSRTQRISAENKEHLKANY